jgi:hypothetical protein
MDLAAGDFSLQKEAPGSTEVSMIACSPKAHTSFVGDGAPSILGFRTTGIT